MGSQGPQSRMGSLETLQHNVPQPDNTDGAVALPTRELTFSISCMPSSRPTSWVSRQRAVAAPGCPPSSGGTRKGDYARGCWKPVSKSMWNCSECHGEHCRRPLERQSRRVRVTQQKQQGKEQPEDRLRNWTGMCPWASGTTDWARAKRVLRRSEMR